MSKYSIEICNFGNWELEKDFSSFELAKSYGIESFAQNEWRIYDRDNHTYAYEHNPLHVLESQARAETIRFSETRRWRQVFIDREEHEEFLREEASRRNLARIADEQRRRQQDNDQRRAERIRGFNFVGARPDVLNQHRPPIQPMNPNVFERLTRAIAEAYDNYDESEEWGLKEKKVNWLKEGF